MAFFEMNLDRFFDMFSLNNKEALFFSIEQFEFRSKEGLEMVDKSDLDVMLNRSRLPNFCL